MLSQKFIHKYMKIARTVAEDNKSCYSRQLGVVIVDPQTNAMSIGYNGPPRGTPHCDSQDYLINVFVPLLSEDEKIKALNNICQLTNRPKETSLEFNEFEFFDKAKDCKVCPRKLINAGPGERSSLCSCQHAERNAIYNAGMNTHGCYMFCWCGVPCVDCTGAIINAGITNVFCLKQDCPDYSPQSRWLFTKAGVRLNLINKDDIL